MGTLGRRHTVEVTKDLHGSRRVFEEKGITLDNRTTSVHSTLYSDVPRPVIRLVLTIFDIVVLNGDPKPRRTLSTVLTSLVKCRHSPKLHSRDTHTPRTFSTVKDHGGVSKTKEKRRPKVRRVRTSGPRWDVPTQPGQGREV